MKDLDITKMEFLLTLNDDIVVQRFFNVKDYNPKAKSSLEFYNFIKSVTEELQYHLKMKAVVYMLENEELIIDDPSVMETSNTDGPEIFNIYVKAGDEIISHRIFDGKIFPPKIRYTVDVRPYLKEILRVLTEIFSNKNLTYQYLNFDLSR